MQYKELFARTKEMNLALWDTLKKYAILVSFKDDFNLQKSIGKGNFAKVNYPPHPARSIWPRARPTRGSMPSSVSKNRSSPTGTQTSEPF